MYWFAHRFGDGSNDGDDVESDIDIDTVALLVNEIVVVGVPIGWIPLTAKVTVGTAVSEERDELEVLPVTDVRANIDGTTLDSNGIGC